MRDAKVGELHAVAPIAEQNVVGFDIPVQDAACVGVRQSVEQLQQHLAQSQPRHDAAMWPQAAARRQLHRQPRTARRQVPLGVVSASSGDLAVVQNHQDMRVVQACDGAHLSS